jgi:hypothetical protein
MSDDKSKTGSPDSKRINIEEQYEVKYWSEKLNVTPDELKKAVKAVGTSAEKVEKHVKNK